MIHWLWGREQQRRVLSRLCLATNQQTPVVFYGEVMGLCDLVSQFWLTWKTGGSGWRVVVLQKRLNKPSHDNHFWISAHSLGSSGLFRCGFHGRTFRISRVRPLAHHLDRKADLNTFVNGLLKIGFNRNCRKELSPLFVLYIYRALFSINNLTSGDNSSSQTFPSLNDRVAVGLWAAVSREHPLSKRDSYRYRSGHLFTPTSPPWHSAM